MAKPPITASLPCLIRRVAQIPVGFKKIRGSREEVLPGSAHAVRKCMWDELDATPLDIFAHAAMMADESD